MGYVPKTQNICTTTDVLVIFNKRIEKGPIPILGSICAHFLLWTTMFADICFDYLWFKFSPEPNIKFLLFQLEIPWGFSHKFPMFAINYHKSPFFVGLCLWQWPRACHPSPPTREEPWCHTKRRRVRRRRWSGQSTAGPRAKCQFCLLRLRFKATNCARITKIILGWLPGSWSIL